MSNEQTHDDRLDKLARKLYGAKARPHNYLGGPNAKIFADALTRIERLEADLADLEIKKDISD